MYRVWGGSQLKSYLNKNIKATNIGESWEISGVKENSTFVAEGLHKGKNLYQLSKEYKSDLLGENVFKTFGYNFPVLIKFIDSELPLSIQVHPNDAQAKKHNCFGKNEMWYIIKADKDATITLGFNKSIYKEEFEYLLETSQVESILNKIKVQKGAIYNIPAGRVHAIGKGVLLAEVQQTSDITYRVYDYNRVDPKTGKTRELHTENAKEVINYEALHTFQTPYKKDSNTQNTILNTEHFITEFLDIDKEFHLYFLKNKSFKIYICVEGSGRVYSSDSETTLNIGETILIPAYETSIKFTSSDSFKLLQVSL